MEASESTATLAPTAEPSPGARHVSRAHGWSIVLPSGWELAAENDSGAALAQADDAIAEILVGPASGLTLEELEAQKVDELSRTWQGAGEIESDFVRLPAGDALRVTFETGLGTASPGVFTFYLLEEGDRQYVISVRGPQHVDDLVADAEALAQSFTIGP